MNTIYFNYFLALFLLVTQIPRPFQKQIDKEITKVFATEDFSTIPVEIQKEVIPSLSLDFSEGNFQQIRNGNNELIGYFFYGTAPSKTDHFDYVVLFDKQLIIKKIKVLAYREDYGGEISSTRWLKQFSGLKEGNSVTYTREIKAISGATISAGSMTRSINLLLKDLRLLKEKQLLP